MKAFTEPLLSLAGFEEMTKTAEKSSGLISVTGCIDAQKSQMIYAFGGHRKNKLIVTFGEQKAKPSVFLPFMMLIKQESW